MSPILVIGFALTVGAADLNQGVGSSTSSVEVTFVVGIPGGATPDPEQIYCVLSIDGWNPQGRPLKRAAAQLFVGVVALPVGQTVEYKFVRAPAWSAVEKAADGGELANRKLLVSSADPSPIVVHKVERWADLPDARSPVMIGDWASSLAPKTAESTITGQVRFHEDFPAPDHALKRTLRILLPPGYEADASRRYPVLYMHDGQNLFDAATSFSGVEWNVDETVDRWVRGGELAPLIVVGIDNTPRRTEEYTPFADARLGGGKADDYLAFLVNEIKPFVDRTYRTLPAREHTAMAGASLGGLVSLYGVLRHGETFGAGGALSTSLMWADWKIVDYVEQFTGDCPERLWLDVDEPQSTPARLLGGEGELAGYLQRIRSTFETKGCGQRSRLRFEQPPGPHHESAWSDRFDEVLLHLFPKTYDQTAHVVH